MGDIPLNIRIQLIDAISKALVRVEQSMKSLQTVSTNLGNALKSTGRELNQLGSRFAVLGGSITAPLVLAFRQASQSSLQYADTMNRVESITQQFSESIASSLQPVIERFLKVLQSVLNEWNSLSQATRDTIVQTTLATGVFLTFGGVLLKIVGTISTIAGAFFQLLGALNPITIAIGAVVAGLVLMTVYWEKVRSVAIPVINGMEVALGTLQIGFLNLRQTAINVLSTIVEKLAQVYELYAKIPGPQQKIFLFYRDLAGKAQAGLAALGQTTATEIKKIEEDISKIFSGENGAIVENIEGIGDTLKKVMDFFKRTVSSDTLPEVRNNFKYMETIAKQTGDGMKRAFEDGFFNIMKGRFKDLQDVAISFGDTVLRAISQALAQFVLINTLGKLPFFAGVFHNGGAIKKAHSGMLSRDEQIIKVRTGEGILNPSAMRSLGEDNFNRLNQGQPMKVGGGGGVNINIFQSISAWDAQDVYRNRKVLADAVSSEISNNQSIRDVIKRNT